MRAKVVHDPGMKPNCRGSIDFNNTGFSSCSMTKSSATFDRVEVKEIGLKPLLKSLIVGALGTGGTSAIFHTRGTLQSRKEWLRMSVIAGASISAYSFNTQFGRLSGPLALVILICLSFCVTSVTVTSIGSSSSVGTQTSFYFNHHLSLTAISSWTIPNIS